MENIVLESFPEGLVMPLSLTPHAGLWTSIFLIQSSQHWIQQNQRGCSQNSCHAQTLLPGKLISWGWEWLGHWYFFRDSLVNLTSSQGWHLPNQPVLRHNHGHVQKIHIVILNLLMSFLSHHDRGWNSEVPQLWNDKAVERTPEGPKVRWLDQD